MAQETYEPIAVQRVQGVEVAVYGDDRGTAERRQHDPVEVGQIYAPEQSSHVGGKIKRVIRTVDVLKRMQYAGTIVATEAKAGRRFRDQFDRAHFDPLQAADLERVIGGEGGDVGKAALQARRQVIAAIHALGGFSCPAAHICWDVLGLGMTIGQWTEHVRLHGCGLRVPSRMNTHRATGIFIASLGVLAQHYGLVK